MDIIKDLSTAADILRKADKIQEYQQILDAMRQLTDQEAEISDLKKENRMLKEEIEVKKSVIHEDDSYFTLDNEIKNGPFCQLCYDSEGKFIRMDVGLFPLGNSYNPTYYSKRCPKCNRYLK